MTRNAPTASDDQIDDLLIRYSRHVEFIGAELTSVHQPGVFGSQILHLAAFADRADDVLTALAAGADVNAIGDLGLSALHYATLGGAVEAARILIERDVDFTIENEYGETARQMADLIGERNVSAVISHVDSTPTHLADGAEAARQRWQDFKAIQEQNFWPEQ